MKENGYMKETSTKYNEEFLENKYKEEESYGMWKWFTIVLKNSLNFKGRSRRAEYASYGIISLAIWLAIVFLIPIDNNEFLGTIAGGILILLIIPSFALNTRRLHDVGLPGYLQLTVIIPIIWGFIALYAMLKETSPKNNKWGAPAKQVGPDK